MNTTGYHAQVSRAAIKELEKAGQFDGDALPYTHEELYDNY